MWITVTFLSNVWIHPFTADDPLVSKWCNAISSKFSQICSNEEINSFISWMTWGLTISLISLFPTPFLMGCMLFLFEFNILYVALFYWWNGNSWKYWSCCPANVVRCTDRPVCISSAAPWMSPCAEAHNRGVVSGMRGCHAQDSFVPVTLSFLSGDSEHFLSPWVPVLSLRETLWSPVSSGLSCCLHPSLASTEAKAFPAPFPAICCKFACPPCALEKQDSSVH